MALLALLLSALASAAIASQVDEVEASLQFASFKAKFGRAYADSQEESARFEHFRASLVRISTHNAKKDRTYDKGLNQFSDMSDDEFAKYGLMASQNCSATHHPSLSAKQLPKGIDLPAHFDWRERGVISEVKSQGHCGSCWTFSTTGCLEAHIAIRSDAWHAPRLSEQQLVDCAQAFDNHGCNGGLPSHAFEYIKSAGGLDTEFHYPYQAKDGKCAFVNPSARNHGDFEPSSAGIGAQAVGGSVNLTVGDEDALKYILATHGPVSIAFQVASDFRDYHQGVYTSEICKNGAGDVNHAVLAVGYGTDPQTGKPYWLVKNSWDYTWGMEGFFKIEAFKNMCGVADCMAFPDVYGVWNPQSSDGETIVV